MNVKTMVCAAFLMFPLSPVQAADSLLDHQYRPLAGRGAVDLRATYGGQVVLVVNTASKCGLAPQFEALEALHSKYAPRGFAVLGFPSGDFREQEFEDETEIREFCTLTYGVQFPMFERVHVVGPQATGLYRDLAEASGGDVPQWNFHKYLIGRDGTLVASWGSRTPPDDPTIVSAIERALGSP
ncbi:glutathione peroxidase [Luteimonas yindakuii]|uniref:Glutathione peroxidase n=2 Tax=Luteimonas yindakuii TaxID=2565782 RepID=A0A4Z1R347_9GAMM|nr:glutathione peroxidase [Luteimonas yindakuii]